MNLKSTESTGSLLSETMQHVTSLVRSEVDLARAEISENINRAATAIGLLVAALVFALTALNVLTAAVVAGLAEAGIEPGWAALIVGLALAVIAYAMLHKGTNDLRLSSIAPNRTAENIRRDAKAMKGTYDVN